jgi:transposase InsO family protein
VINGSVYMTDDFQNEIRFPGIESSTAFVRQPEGNGCIERFFRTLKERLLWVRCSRDLSELSAALIEFRERYNQQWIIERRPPSPAQTRRAFELASPNRSVIQ